MGRVGSFFSLNLMGGVLFQTLEILLLSSVCYSNAILCFTHGSLLLPTTSLKQTYAGASLSSAKVLALLQFYFSIMHYSCSESALCCSAGGGEEEEDADEIWIISSQCLAKPHSAGTAAFSM